MSSSAATIFLAVTWAVALVSVNCNYYFTTHDYYKTSTIIGSDYDLTKVSGHVAAVTQQCRRTCASRPNCGAYTITLLSGSKTLGVFSCRFFRYSACDWERVSFRATSGSSFVGMWEKLDAIQYKPKPCINYCKVQFRGNCTACRGYSNLAGLDCDTAPKFCSDYAFTGWALNVPIWPWGFYGTRLVTNCFNEKTQLIATKPMNNSISLSSIGQAGAIIAQNTDAFRTWQQSIDWELIAELAALASKKILRFRLILNNVIQDYTYSGMHVSPRGDLSINASLNAVINYGIPLPILEVPFVYDSRCGAFWQFTPTVPLCNQGSILLNFTSIRWNGTNYSNYTEVAILMT